MQLDENFKEISDILIKVFEYNDNILSFFPDSHKELMSDVMKATKLFVIDKLPHWKPFKNRYLLKLGDIVLLESGKKAVLTSSLSSGEPDGLNMMTENVSMSFDFNGDPLLYDDGTLVDVEGDEIDKIIKVLSL